VGDQICFSPTIDKLGTPRSSTIHCGETEIAEDHISRGGAQTTSTEVRIIQCQMSDGTNHKHRYQGYNKDLIDRFVAMGFDLDRVVDAFNFVNIDRNNGEDYELEEAYMGDITARLLGEP
jgi:hypothetical protein